VYFDETDVVRHHLVQRIVRAYDEHKNRLAEEQLSLLDSKSAANGNGSPPIEHHSGVPMNEEASE
jgi:hypothetical protein